MDTISISKGKIEKQGGIVILPLREYQELCARAVPTFYLKGKTADRLDKLVDQGLAEYKKGKTIKAASLREALKIYGEKNNKKY